jgi:tRNA A37 threonylcarbamoyladenosine synthetase subunit TsaC/SUA5/YrdC
VQALGAHIALVIDAGPAPGGAPSSVVRVTGDRIEVLREGAIPAGLLVDA